MHIRNTTVSEFEGTCNLEQARFVMQPCSALLCHIVEATSSRHVGSFGVLIPSIVEAT